VKVNSGDYCHWKRKFEPGDFKYSINIRTGVFLNTFSEKSFKQACVNIKKTEGGIGGDTFGGKNRGCESERSLIVWVGGSADDR